MKDNSGSAKIKVDKTADANIAGSGEVQGSVQMQRIAPFRSVCVTGNSVFQPNVVITELGLVLADQEENL